MACCDGQAAWDTFGNLFLVYINDSVNQINVILSTDGGATFSAPVTAGTGSVDQPSIAVGNGSVWVDWNQSGSMVARGAPVTGLGAWGPFNAQQAIPSATGSFGGIAVGPGPNGGKVIVTYQSPTGGQGPATIFANVDADGLGAGGFGARITVSPTNVGGFDFIPAQNGRSIDAEAGLVWDATGGPFNNRIYLVYTDETVNENNDTDILMRTSTDDGATWSAPVRVNDDATTNSQFLPYVTLDPTTGTVAVGFHDCRNDNGVPGPGGTNTIPNDDAEYYGTFSTDGGATWAPNRRLSGGFSNAAAAANGIDFGDYVGLSRVRGQALRDVGGQRELRWHEPEWHVAPVRPIREPTHAHGGNSVADANGFAHSHSDADSLAHSNCDGNGDTLRGRLHDHSDRGQYRSRHHGHRQSRG